MKKFLWGAALLSVVALASCSSIDALGNEVNATSGVDPTNAGETYAFAGVTSLLLQEEGGETTTEEDIVGKYLAIYEQLSSEALTVSYAETSDRAEYVYQANISVNDLDGTSYSYVLYFNEIVKEEDSEDEDIPGEDDDTSDETGDSEEPETPELPDEDEDSEEVSVESSRKSHHHDHKHHGECTKLEGILVDGETEYVVLGEKREHHETTTLSFYLIIDETSFSYFSSKTCAEATTYTYMLVANEELVRYSSITTLTEEGVDYIVFTTWDVNGYALYQFATVKTASVTYVEIHFYTATEAGLIRAFIITNEDGTTSVEYVYTPYEVPTDDDDSDDDWTDDSEDDSEEDWDWGDDWDDDSWGDSSHGDEGHGQGQDQGHGHGHDHDRW